MGLTESFTQAAAGLAHEPAFAGVELVAFSCKKRAGASALTVIIDKPGGVDMHLCERVSAHIRRNLGDDDGLYTLEVESAGLDRPLFSLADFQRFAGQNVKVVTSLTIGNAKTHRGVLRGAKGDIVLLETPAGALPIPHAAIKSANIEYDVRADLKRDKLERRKP